MAWGVIPKNPVQDGISLNLKEIVRRDFKLAKVAVICYTQGHVWLHDLQGLSNTDSYTKIYGGIFKIMQIITLKFYFKQR